MADDITKLGFCTALELFDPEAEARREKAELQMLCRLQIGSRVAVRFSSKMDEKFRMIDCEPYTAIGEVWGLQRDKNRGWVDILFDGEEKPVSAFRALEVMLIDSAPTP